MNAYALLSPIGTDQSVHQPTGTRMGLPAHQSERDLMLDRQSSLPVGIPKLSQAPSPLCALVAGEPSTEAGHRRLHAQARGGTQRFSQGVHQSSRALALDKLSASTK